MTVSVGLFLVALVTCAICFAGIVVIGRARRSVRGSDAAAGFASRADTQRLLAENWAQVEQTARASGMSDDEIKQVRANVLGLDDH